MSAAGAIMGATSIIKTGIDLYAGDLEDAQRQIALDEYAKAKDKEAEETIERGKINARVIEREFRQKQGEAVSGFGRAGIDLSGSALIALEDNAMVAAREQVNNKRESEFRAEQLRAEAKSARRGVRDISEARPLRQWGTILGGVGGAAGGIGSTYGKG